MAPARRPLAVWWLLAGVLVALIAACSADEPPRAGRAGVGIHIDLNWHAARRVAGHRVHVLEQKVACRACHEMSAPDLGRVNVSQCASCHAEESSIEHASKQAAQRFGPDAKSDCTVCHAFGLEDAGADAEGQAGAGSPSAVTAALSSFAPGDCQRCHELPQGSLPPVGVHSTQPCLSCHRPHEDNTPHSADCSDCHAEIHATHGEGKSPTEACRTCHEHQHAAASEARASCESCHATHQPLVPGAALFEGGHSACIDCHAPHAFEKSAVVACRSCHAEQKTLAGRPDAHAACASCHAPHDVRGSAASSCQNCHRAVHSDHPQRAGSGACTDCHDPHPSTAHPAVAAPCSSCHDLASSDHAAHGGVECASCHRPHEFLKSVAGQVACRACHDHELKHAASNEGHSDCQDCHAGLPHRPEASSPRCDGCHQRPHADVRKGHDPCTSCHEPHSGAPAMPCGGCHEAQRHAPAGHQACTQCHEPHSGSPERSACSQCHTGAAATPHGKLPGGCTTCHSPHSNGVAADAPACTSCHRTPALPGLHALGKHQSCSSCHAGHGEPPGSLRSTCVSCHLDRKSHFPDARCANCHLFSKTR